MERVCFLARVRPGRLDEYRARHEAVWPEMRDALRAAGWVLIRMRAAAGDDERCLT